MAIYIAEYVKYVLKVSFFFFFTLKIFDCLSLVAGSLSRLHDGDPQTNG